MNYSKYSTGASLSKKKSKMSEAEKALADMEIRKALDKLPKYIIDNPELLEDALNLLSERLPAPKKSRTNDSHQNEHSDSVNHLFQGTKSSGSLFD